jgi:galactose mutarotase-like enzyme
MIEKCRYKEIEAIKLENDVLKIIVIPSMGGKVASIYRKDKKFELLFQNKEEIYRKPKVYDEFFKYDASGFDDAFPTIDEGNVRIGEKNVIYPDHGEIWAASFTYEIKGKKVECMYQSEIIDYKYKKTFSLLDDILTIEYEIVNTGVDEFPCIWAMHNLMVCEEDMELIFPENTKEVINVRNSEFLGESGRIYLYPATINSLGQVFNFNKVLPASANNMEKYYVKGPVTQGCCGAYYPSKDINYRVYYDKEKLPYLGFWVTEGGFRGDYNCALEPTNGYYDSIDIAKNEGNICVLRPMEILEFNLKMELK